MLTIQSANSEEALVYDDQSLFIYVRHTDEYRGVSPGQARIWLNSHEDLRSVNLVSLNELKDSLGRYADCRAAMKLALYAIDPSIRASTRDMAAECLDSLIDDDTVRLWLEDLFFVQSLPNESVDLAVQVIESAKAKNLDRVMKFYSPVIDKQNEISRLSETWGEIENSGLLGSSHFEIFDDILGTGLFTKLAFENKEISAHRLAQAVLLNTKVSFDSETVARVIGQLPLEFDEIADVIGFAQTLAGVDHCDLWKNTLNGSTKFVIGCNELDRARSLGSPAIQQDLLVNIKGRTEYVALPSKLYEIAVSQFKEEHEHLTPQFMVDTSLVVNDRRPDVKSASERVASWGRRPSRGICKSWASSFGSFFVSQ